jgi:hypothetical protein
MTQLLSILTLSFNLQAPTAMAQFTHCGMPNTCGGNKAVEAAVVPEIPVVAAAESEGDDKPFEICVYPRKCGKRSTDPNAAVSKKPLLAKVDLCWLAGICQKVSEEVKAPAAGISQTCVWPNFCRNEAPKAVRPQPAVVASIFQTCQMPNTCFAGA